MNNERYNGWSNHPTWKVNLEVFDGFDPRHAFGARAEAECELAGFLRDYAQNLIEATTEPGFARNAAMSFIEDVEWWEIADSMIDTYYDADEE